jgi:hypothetical protein
MRSWLTVAGAGLGLVLYVWFAAVKNREDVKKRKASRRSI